MWRAHLKSNGHVYNLQLSVAAPGSIPSAPAPPPAEEATEGSGSAAAPYARIGREPDSHAAQDEDVIGSDTEDEVTVPDFAPGGCLFCARESESGTLDDSLTHMTASHGFTVPFQDFLAVDLGTIVAHLHLLIYGYRDCIYCRTHRSTVEGVQQHMVAKGHCRFDVSPETEEFYAMPQSESALLDQAESDASVPVRLPSGKLISHRKHLDIQEPRASRRATADRVSDHAAPRSATSSAAGHELVQRGGASGSGQVVRSSEAILAAQLSKLRIAGDRVQQKEADRKRGRLERANNSIMLKHYRLDSGDGRIDRRF
ncbi:hypothetical protein RJ55_01009 [Drechmeria coniospora]|nr:hypothetical protein RJ55_01009 [Drechmeria coniospora]